MFLPSSYLFLFLFSSSVFVGKALSVHITIETSSLGMESFYESDWKSKLRSLYESEDEGVHDAFYQFIQAHYFDYSEAVLDICSQNDKEGNLKIIQKMANHDVPANMIADCICVSASNDHWQDEVNFPVNPMTSRHFSLQDWAPSQFFYFLKLGKKNPSIRRAFLSKNSNIQFLSTKPHLQRAYFDVAVWNKAGFSLWKDIVLEDKALDSIAKFPDALLGIIAFGLNGFSNELVASHLRLVMIVLIARKHSSNEIIQQTLQEFINAIDVQIQFKASAVKLFWNSFKNLLQLSENNSVDFFCELLALLAPIATSAVILNLFYFWKLFNEVSHFHQWKPFFIPALELFFAMEPTVEETCQLLYFGVESSDTSNEHDFGLFINANFLSSHHQLVQDVYNENPALISETLKHEVVTLQARLERTLKSRRRLPEAPDFWSNFFVLPATAASDPFEDLQLIFTQSLGFADPTYNAYNYPMLEFSGEGYTRRHFSHYIDRFFTAYLAVKEFHVVINEGIREGEDSASKEFTIIPSFKHHPTFSRVLGFMIGAAFILQQPAIPFSIPEDYFNLHWLPESSDTFLSSYPLLLHDLDCPALRKLFTSTQSVSPSTSTIETFCRPSLEWSGLLKKGPLSFQEATELLKANVKAFMTGLSFAVDVHEFTPDELYYLLFPSK